MDEDGGDSCMGMGKVTAEILRTVEGLMAISILKVLR